MNNIFHQPQNSKSNYNFNSTIYNETDWAPHFHRGLELIYVMKGTLSLTVQQMKKELKEGDFALVLSNQIHSLRSSLESETLVVVFSEDFVPKFTSLTKGKQAKEISFKVSDTVANLVKEYLTKEETSILMKKSCFYAVCSEFLSQMELEERRDKSDFVMGELLDYIAEHYTENLSLRLLAEKYGYEYHYLSRLLSKNYNINFKELLNRYRTEKALELLQETDMSITEVALKSGFQSIRNFNLIFKEATGVSPNEYR